MGKKAILIGCNYPKEEKKYRLHGCMNDVRCVRDCVIALFDFRKDDISILIDTNEKFMPPTRENILQALSGMVDEAKPGDFLFVHFSGHGGRLQLEEGEEDETGYNECIYPSDMNPIFDDEFRALVHKVPDGCRMTIICDSCHSGGLVEGLKEQIGKSCTHQGTLEPLHERGEYSLDTVFKHDAGEVVEREAEVDDGHVEENRSLPLSALIEFLKKKTGKKHIDTRNVGAALNDVFGEKACHKIKKAQYRGALCELPSLIKMLTKYFRGEKESSDEKVNENDDKCYPKNGILISGCQTDEEAKNAKFTEETNGALTDKGAKNAGKQKEIMGALTNAVLTILYQTNGEISNKELVVRAGELLKTDRPSQHPGLYCSDSFLADPFICN